MTYDHHVWLGRQISSLNEKYEDNSSGIVKVEESFADPIITIFYTSCVHSGDYNKLRLSTDVRIPD